MSNFTRITKHPKTGKFMPAEFLDNYFGPHRYGVCFDGEKVYREDEHEWEFEDATVTAKDGTQHAIRSSIGIEQVKLDPSNPSESTIEELVKESALADKRAFVKACGEEIYAKPEVTQKYKSELQLIVCSCCEDDCPRVKRVFEIMEAVKREALEEAIEALYKRQNEVTIERRAEAEGSLGREYLCGYEGALMNARDLVNALLRNQESK